MRETMIFNNGAGCAGCAGDGGGGGTMGLMKAVVICGSCVEVELCRNQGLRTQIEENDTGSE